MIFGAIAGLLAAVGYTLATGRLQRAKGRIAYGTPARLTAIAELMPLAGLTGYAVSTGHTVNEPGGMGLFVTAILGCIVVIYGIGWPLGQKPPY